jgi:8-oxo-dGTP pyrophosphatase MutT (NUDIX family)
MKVIKEIDHSHIGLQKSKEDIKYDIRKAARAVLINENKQVALLHVMKDGYYKLPGGGIEGDETTIQALVREVYEEVGSGIEIMDEIGMVLEYRDQFEQLQISYSFLCETKGVLVEPSFTQKELDHGFQLEWKTIEDAMKAIESYSGEKYVAKFITLRDFLIVQEAIRIILLQG